MDPMLATPPVVGDILKKDIPIVANNPLTGSGGNSLGFGLSDIQSLFTKQSSDITKLVSPQLAGRSFIGFPRLGAAVLLHVVVSPQRRPLQ